MTQERLAATCRRARAAAARVFEKAGAEQFAIVVLASLDDTGAQVAVQAEGIEENEFAEYLDREAAYLRAVAPRPGTTGQPGGKDGAK